jgi:hypothetical protein
MPAAAFAGSRNQLTRRAAVRWIGTAAPTDETGCGPLRPSRPALGRRAAPHLRDGGRRRYGSSVRTSVEEFALLVLATEPRAPAYLPLPPTMAKREGPLRATTPSISIWLPSLRT